MTGGFILLVLMIIVFAVIIMAPGEAIQILLGSAWILMGVVTAGSIVAALLGVRM